MCLVTTWQQQEPGHQQHNANFYASTYSAITGAANGLLPVLTQAIFCPTDGLIFTKKFESKYNKFHSMKSIWKYRLQNGDHVVPSSMR